MKELDENESKFNEFELEREIVVYFCTDERLRKGKRD